MVAFPYLKAVAGLAAQAMFVVTTGPSPADDGPVKYLSIILRLKSTA